jgi:hypothetical protein
MPSTHASNAMILVFLQCNRDPCMHMQTKQQRDTWLDEHNRRSLAELGDQKRKAAEAAKKVSMLAACTRTHL